MPAIIGIEAVGFGAYQAKCASCMWEGHRGSKADAEAEADLHAPHCEGVQRSGPGGNEVFACTRDDIDSGESPQAGGPDDLLRKRAGAVVTLRDNKDRGNLDAGRWEMQVSIERPFCTLCEGNEDQLVAFVLHSGSPVCEPCLRKYIGEEYL